MPMRINACHATDDYSSNLCLHSGLLGACHNGDHNPRSTSLLERSGSRAASGTRCQNVIDQKYGAPLHLGTGSSAKDIADNFTARGTTQSASCRVPTVRFSERRIGSLSCFAIPSASASAWLYPRRQ